MVLVCAPMFNWKRSSQLFTFITADNELLQFVQWVHNIKPEFFIRWLIVQFTLNNVDFLAFHTKMFASMTCFTSFSPCQTKFFLQNVFVSTKFAHSLSSVFWCILCCFLVCTFSVSWVLIFSYFMDTRWLSLSLFISSDFLLACS